MTVNSLSSNRRKTVSGGKMDATRKRIERMEEEREERRRAMNQRKLSRKAESARLLAAGNPGDVDFIGMVEEWRAEQARKQKGSNEKSYSRNNNIIVAVRKRPMFEKERLKKDHDSVSCYSPKIWIHSAKFRVDGISKYLTHTGFQFDHTFGEESTTDQIYVATTLPLIDHVVRTRGRATVFCYGQTGSGKTHTMNGIQKILAHDLYEETRDQGEDIEIRLAFFELYNGYIQDLLHGRKRCKLLEDGKGEVNITGLQEVRAASPEEFLRVIEEGQNQRTTRSTEANDSSSRSHAICQVFLRDASRGKLKGKMTLVDLAGSERGSDTKSHDSTRRSESAEINTSLLSLKECIRALGQKGSHVPYRGSKLTLILKDCFSPDSKTTMIAMVSPGASSTDHSLNTLRYADRIKEQRISSSKKEIKKEGSKSNVKLTTEPSNERLSRIVCALYEDKTTVNDSKHNDIPPVAEETDEKQTHLVCLQSDVVDISGEFDIGKDGQYVEVIPAEVISEKSISHRGYNKQESSSNDEEVEMRRTAQALFELEETLLDQHITNIKENAEMLRHEDALLQTIEQLDNPTDDDMDTYAIQLLEFLDRKEGLLLSLQSKLDEYKTYLSGEDQLVGGMSEF